MSFLGKTYTLERNEKFDEFLASLGVSKEKIAEIEKNTATVTTVKNGDTYTQTVTDHEPVNFKSGVEFDDKVNNTETKSVIEVNGDTVTHTQKFKNGLTLTYKNEYSGDKLVVTATNSGWDGVAHRYYSA